MDDASPTKWHLAHTSWFFETFVLDAAVPGYRPFHPEFRVLFNSYYQTVGAQHPRPQRGLLTRPTLDEVRDYRRHVDAQLLALLRSEAAGAAVPVIELGLHHDQQHQALILTDAKHLLASNPLRPAYHTAVNGAAAMDVASHWERFEGGTYAIGAGDGSFAFDNERPRHRILLEPFALASRPVTNGEFLEFIADGGYRRPELWLSDGWSVATAADWRAPLYWEPNGVTRTLAGRQPLVPTEPVCHVSYYEADAFARWAGARLPTEAEWEVAASNAVVAGNLLDSGRLHPAPAPTLATGMSQ